MNPTYEDYRWLVGQGGRAWLDHATQDSRSCATGSASASSRSELALTTTLRRDLSADRTHLVLELLTLRRRARAKFARANQMFFTRITLEQATDQIVATYKAGHLPNGTPVFDLCCGIGGDLAALADRGPAIGVDLDRVHALFARHNSLLGNGAGSVEVVTGDVTQLHLERESVWHVDPDRRVAGRRSAQVACHSPAQQAIEAMLDRAPHAAIKLAPAAEVPESWQARAELEWISRGNECRQLVVRFGQWATQPGLRKATILDATALDEIPRSYSVVGSPGRPPRCDRVQRYVFEPDPAVLAADLSGVLAEQCSLEALTGGGGYLTGEQPIDSPAITCFETLETLPFDKRRVKRLLTERAIGRLEIKTRGVPIQPEMLRRQLRVPGDNPGVLLVMRQGDSVTVVLARRVG